MDTTQHGGLSAEQYQLLVEAITDYGIYMLTPEGLISSWNAGARRFKGYEAHEVLGRHFSIFFTPEDLDLGVPENALRIAQEEGRFETQGWRLRKDGSRFWAHAIVDPIRDADGRLLGFAKITRDMTERRMAEMELHRSQDMFRRLVMGVTDYALYMISPEGIVTNWNAGAERIKGYAPDEIIGQHFGRFYPEEERAAGGPDQALRIARETGKFEKEGWRVRKDGTRFMAHVVIDAIREPDGTLIGFAKITRDITERVRAQQELDKAREQLLQSQKMQAIGQLTGGVAHDFNNLLMAVLSSLELLEKRVPLDPQALRLLGNARQGAERGAALTRSMLAFARRQDMTVEPVDLAELVRSMQEMLGGSLGALVSLETNFPSDLPLAITDPNHLATAVLNLAVNARDAMPGGGTITISADADRDFVRLRVEDTGEGMPQDVLERAREPFFTTKGVGKGTGLGLSMVHGLAEESGGALRLESAPGAGTTATILLPLAAAPSEQPAAPAQQQPPPVSDAEAGALRIIAVDDDPLVLMNTVMMAEDLGHAVTPCGSGPQALEALETQACDLVITDHAMPQMTGLELAAIIAERRPDLPVLLATGYAELPENARALPVLNKPFSQDDLARALTDAAKARLAAPQGAR
ncbi:MAG TPA: PAS domain S-box protein [Devosia sp.]|uniref:hybrid sensor histidine kinase/response regulator n=1 Tax=Devosia sp. TaxID=1871048 RepID=UPI002F955FC2